MKGVTVFRPERLHFWGASNALTAPLNPAPADITPGRLACELLADQVPNCFLGDPAMGARLSNYWTPAPLSVVQDLWRVLALGPVGVRSAGARVWPFAPTAIVVPEMATE